MRVAILLLGAVLATSQDTAGLAAQLRAVRRQVVLAPDQYRRIQDHLLRWIDTRYRRGTGADEMNRELKAAGLLFDQHVDADNLLDLKRVGFLDKLSVHDRGPFKMIVAGIYSNDACGLNQTAALYKSQDRVAVIQPDDSASQALTLSDLAMGGGDAGVLVASGWIYSNCTSSWNGSTIRIDVIQDTTRRKVLESLPGARQLDAVPIRAQVEGDIVTFRYAAGMADGELMARPGIARYKVQRDRAIRLAPIALTLGGFTDEWIRMDTADIQPWSAPAAARAHSAVQADFSSSTFRWHSFAKCCLDESEVGVLVERPQKIYVFTISGTRAADLKMTRVAGAHTCTAHELPDTNGLKVIAEELP